MGSIKIRKIQRKPAKKRNNLRKISVRQDLFLNISDMAETKNVHRLGTKAFIIATACPLLIDINL